MNFNKFSKLKKRRSIKYEERVFKLTDFDNLKTG